MYDDPGHFDLYPSRFSFLSIRGFGACCASRNGWLLMSKSFAWKASHVSAAATSLHAFVLLRRFLLFPFVISVHTCD